MIASRSALCSRTLIVGAAALAMAAASPGQNPPANQQPPAFKSGVTIVPLDVRVLDKDGRPITDLRQDDFRIVENGVPQTIAHFMAQALVADQPQPALRASTKAEPFDPTPQTRRVFLIVLGRGALGDTRVYPQTLNALLRFIRENLLPQDQVGLLGYNRAVDFTTDHEKLARLLETIGRSTGAPGRRWRSRVRSQHPTCRRCFRTRRRSTCLRPSGPSSAWRTTPGPGLVRATAKSTR
jgi:hypothetical protein